MTPTPQPQEAVTKDSAAPLCEGDNEKLFHLVAALEMYGKHGGTLISREDAAVASDLLDRAMKRIAALSADQDAFPVAYVAPASLGTLSAAAKAGRYEYVDAGSLPGHDAVALYTKAQPQEETLRVLLDNLVIAQSLSREIRQRATDEARAYLYDLRQRPKPSTREAEAPVSEAVAWRLDEPVTGTGFYDEKSDAETDQRRFGGEITPLFDHPAPSPASATEGAGE